MQKRWILIIDEYSNLTKKAINMLCGTFSTFLDYVLPVKLISDITDEQIKNNNILVVGNINTNCLLEKCSDNKIIDTPTTEQEYSVFVGKSIFNEQNQMILIAGFDAAGLLYGCADFCNKYCSDLLFSDGDIWDTNFFEKPFDRPLCEWKINLAPAIKTRAIWTWGHVIYDYKKFLDNMARLKLNQIVIWNDVVPLNANDIVEYAHSLHIKVIWGFAWGWATKCANVLNHIAKNGTDDLKKHVLNTYNSQYKNTKGDGIYFQSFTELNAGSKKGKMLTLTVTQLVNDICSELLEQNPNLHIQFGLHATSVKNHLDIIKNVDERIYIVWEDCGAFPYNYYPNNITDFDKTLELTKRLVFLRGKNEKFGAVLKGTLKLDWNHFEHFNDSYILGERSNEYIRTRQMQKNKIWKIIQAGWLKNAEYLRKVVNLAHQNANEPIFEALVEDAMFENQIMFPVALYSEILWTPNQDIEVLKEQVAKYSCVNFANI